MLILQTMAVCRAECIWAHLENEILAVGVAIGLMDEYETMLAEVTVERRVKQPETKRSECTRSRALSYAKPTEAHTDLDFKPQGSTAAKLLIAKCAASSGLNDIATEVRADHEARFVTRHRATLEQKKAAQ